MPSIPGAEPCQTQDEPMLTDEDMQLMDMLALHVICGTLREVRR